MNVAHEFYTSQLISLSREKAFKDHFNSNNPLKHCQTIIAIHELQLAMYGVPNIGLQVINIVLDIKTALFFQVSNILFKLKKVISAKHLYFIDICAKLAPPVFICCLLICCYLHITFYWLILRY